MQTIEVNQQTDALIIIDMQPDFMEGGPLAVPGGMSLVAPVNRAMALFPKRGATQDWHPADHSSFASRHPGKAPLETVDMPYGVQVLWPGHCIQDTPGAALHPGLDQSGLLFVIRKGGNPAVDSYSGFFENDRQTPTGLEATLRSLGVTRLFLCGIASDFCVGYTAEDAVKIGFETYLVEDLCRGIGIPLTSEECAAAALPEGATTIDATRARLEKAGAQWISSSSLAAESPLVRARL